MNLSIIIPTFNEAAGIQQAIDRAFALSPCEVIVVDGGSQDDTVSFAKASSAQVYSSAAGRALQQNLGASRATGEFLLFLHADTWLAESVHPQLEEVLNSPDFQLGAFWQKIEAEGFVYRLLERGNAYRVARWGLVYGDQGMLVRRAFFEKFGGFPEEPFLEDLIFSQNARRVQWPLLLPGPLHVSARRWQKQGVFKQTLRNWTILTAHQCGISPKRLAEYY
ncbi:EAL domain-containing protein/glycosyl transferase [Planctomycetales bacterium 10988]|nr:EAL domain-containing protein/glycosyl transferase [Planctomycetales bacterium 10988]